mgnify:CR=1 FL=1
MQPSGITQPALKYSFDFSAPLAYWPDLLAGAWTTLTLSLASTVFGFMVGVLCALATTGRAAWLARVANVYIEVIRNTPLLVQVFIVYFGMSSMGFQVGAFTAATIALVVNVGAYTAEIVRAGIQSIPKGQAAAASALGLTYFASMRSVILPQVFRNMTPILLTQTIVLFQDTSLVYVLSVTDFLGAASKIAQRDGRLVEMYLFAAVVYFAVCFVASLAVRRLQKKIAIIR